MACLPAWPENFVNELYYGIEQIGWDGESKPEAMHQIKYVTNPPLPHRSESAEILAATAAGVDIGSGNRTFETEDERYDVSGILLGRPFKVVRVGPVRLFLEDIAAAIPFYRDVLGLAVTEEVVWNGHRCVFLRANTEHHSLALYPVALRDELGLRPDSKLFSTGFQVADYRQLRDAVAYFREAAQPYANCPPNYSPASTTARSSSTPTGTPSNSTTTWSKSAGRQTAHRSPTPQSHPRPLARTTRSHGRHIPRRSLPRPLGLDSSGDGCCGGCGCVAVAVAVVLVVVVVVAITVIPSKCRRHVVEGQR